MKRVLLTFLASSCVLLAWLGRDWVASDLMGGSREAGLFLVETAVRGRWAVDFFQWTSALTATVLLAGGLALRPGEQKRRARREALAFLFSAIAILAVRGVGEYEIQNWPQSAQRSWLEVSIASVGRGPFGDAVRTLALMATANTLMASLLAAAFERVALRDVPVGRDEQGDLP